MLADGSIWFGDVEVTDPRTDEDELRRSIGIVFQAYNLFPHLSVLDNVTLAPIKVRGLSRAEARDRAMVLLERVGLADKASAHPDAMSGGQQQRAALVRAMAMEPELLLLDEITSALDPMLVGEVLDVVREIRTDGQAIVMATHEIGFAREAADRVAFLKDGPVPRPSLRTVAVRGREVRRSLPGRPRSLRSEWTGPDTHLTTRRTA